jgi:hypothetical protein
VAPKCRGCKTLAIPFPHSRPDAILLCLSLLCLRRFWTPKQVGHRASVIIGGRTCNVIVHSRFQSARHPHREGLDKKRTPGGLERGSCAAPIMCRRLVVRLARLMQQPFPADEFPAGNGCLFSSGYRDSIPLTTCRYCYTACRFTARRFRLFMRSLRRAIQLPHHRVQVK